MSYTDNLSEIDAFWAASTPPARSTLDLSNVAEYASWLHQRTGFYVFSDTKAIEVVLATLQEVLAAGLPLTNQNIARALESSGYEILNFLKSLTSVMRPPVKDGEGPRRAHPGNWADVTAILAGSYSFMVTSGMVRKAG